MMMTKTLTASLLVIFIAIFYSTAGIASSEGEDNSAISTSIDPSNIFKMGYSGQGKIFEFLKKIIDPFQPKREKVIQKFGPLATQVISGDGIESLVSTIASMPKRCIGPVRGFVDDELGDFITTDDSPYCDTRCFRNLPCCAPSRPEEIGAYFLYSNGKDPARFVKRGDQAFYNDIHSSGKPLVFYASGLLENYTVVPTFNDTRDGFLAHGYNFIIVDWSLSKFVLNQLLADARVVGAIMGSMIQWLGYAHKTTCMGMSAGSPVCHETAKWLKERGLLLSKCIGVDPGSPLIQGCPQVQLGRSDCEVVVAVHTSGLISTGLLGYAAMVVGGSGLGTSEKVGHCDFWVNSASLQPNCLNATPTNYLNNLIFGRLGPLTVDFENFLVCSHLRAEYIVRSQAKHLCHFTGARSVNCDFHGSCHPLDPRFIAPDDPAPLLMPLPPWDTCTSDMRADYHVSATGTEPYC